MAAQQPANVGPILQPAPALVPVARPHSMFNQLYSIETKDPCKKDYRQVMIRFDASRDGAIAGDLLFQQVVLSGGNIPQAYQCCGNTTTGPRIFCLHCSAKFIGAFDGTVSPWNDLSFAFIGEVVQKMATSVFFLNEAFNANTLLVKTMDYILQHLDELNDLPVFPPILPGEDDSEEVTTRNFIFLPAVYAPLLLNSRGYTPKQMWEILHPALLHRQELEICAPLLRWLQAASVGTATMNPLEMGAPQIAIVMNAPPADVSLFLQCQQILNQHLPGLSAPLQALETALTKMAMAILAQTNDTRQARELKAAEEQAPKLPSKRFKVTLPVLMEYLQVEDERNLPDIWHQWSNCAKKQEIQVLWAADDIKNGLHPFIVTDGNSEHRQHNLEVARLYGLITAGNATCSLSDLEALTAKEVRSVPLTYWELEHTLGMFGNLSAVLLGTTHPVVMAFKELWNLMRSSIREDLHAAIEHCGHVKPTHILCSVQLILYAWFSHRRAKLAPPSPDFKAIIHQILMQVYVLPMLPLQLYQLAYPKRSTNPAGSVPGTVATASTASTASTSLGTQASTNSSTVSGLTAASGASQGQGLTPGPSRGARIANLAPIPGLVNLVPSATKLKDLMGSSSPPRLDNGAEMCLSYLFRGGCWSNCRRIAQHTPNLSAPEKQRLKEYLTQCLTPAPTAAASVPTTHPALTVRHRLEYQRTLQS